MTPPLRFEVRNVKFDVHEHVPKAWLGGRRAVSAYFDNLSIFFPPGERFFVQSVNGYRERISDPKLLAEMRVFAAQEGCHNREHIRYNELSEKNGYPAVAMEGRVTRLLERVSRRVPLRRQLAVTCALEHFTSLLGDQVLTDPRILEGAHPRMAALWRWHSAEENEHKGVAFDVYRAAGGFWLERIAIMLITTLIFWAKVIEQQLRMMWADRTLFSLTEWADLIGYLFITPGTLTRILPRYLDYYRPSFHPWDHDNHHLLESWEQSEYRVSPEYPQFTRAAR